MSVNDYAAHQARKQDRRTDAERRAGVTVVDFAYPPGDVRRYGAKPDEPVHEAYIPADPIGVEESALTDTFVGKLKKFWGG